MPWVEGHYTNLKPLYAQVKSRQLSTREIVFDWKMVDVNASKQPHIPCVRPYPLKPTQRRGVRE